MDQPLEEIDLAFVLGVFNEFSIYSVKSQVDVLTSLYQMLWQREEDKLKDAMSDTEAIKKRLEILRNAEPKHLAGRLLKEV